MQEFVFAQNAVHNSLYVMENMESLFGVLSILNVNIRIK